MLSYKYVNYASTIQEIKHAPHFTYRLVMDKLRLKYSVFTEEEICLPHFPFRQKNTYVSIYDIRTKLIAASTVI